MEEGRKGRGTVSKGGAERGRGKREGQVAREGKRRREGGRRRDEAKFRDGMERGSRNIQVNR